MEENKDAIAFTGADIIALLMKVTVSDISDRETRKEVVRFQRWVAGIIAANSGWDKLFDGLSE